MLKKEQQRWLDIVSNNQHPTPYMLTDLQLFRNNVKLLQELLPRVAVFYAVKSRSDSEVIRALDDLVVGYDIASLGEYKMLADLGVSADRMLYSNPVKIPEHIAGTHKAGVKYFAFDSLDEAKKIASIAPGSNVYLRVKVSDYGSKFPLSSKFGVDPLHAVAYADTAKELGLNVCGLSFHVGSQSENPKTWSAAIKTAGQIIKRLEAAHIEITMVNMGGGFPAVYTEPIASIQEMAEVINQAIDKHLPPDVHIVAEPGRFVSANTSLIVTSVLAREHRGGAEWLFVDMGVFQGLMEPLEMSDWKYPVFSIYGKDAHEFSKPFVLTGPTCDAYDTIGLNYSLPSNIKVGDQVFIGMTGAYTTVYASNFNGFPPPDIYYLPVQDINKKESKIWQVSKPPKPLQALLNK